MLLVAGVDTLWRITGKEVDIELQTTDLFYNGQAFLFGDTWIDGALIHHAISI